MPPTLSQVFYPNPVPGQLQLIYHTAHKTAEDMAIPIPIVVSALVHAASVMAQIYDCRESFDSAIKVNRLEASRLEEIRGGYQDGKTTTREGSG
jgi:hypothetical protein